MAKEEQYFTWDNFDEIAELEKHFSFIKDMLDKYEWKECDKGEFVQKIEIIKEKQKKNKIVISVLGETSIGKSTFINALLKTDLLSSGVLQKTTIVPTIVEYAVDCQMELLYKNGEEKKLFFEDIEELRSKVTEYTTMEEAAKDIVKIFVRIPSKILSDGFVIIDTPGLNSGIQWNETECIKEMEKNSDALIVLTDMNKALPQSLVQYIKARLSDSLKKCIFLGTKSDVIYHNKEEFELQIGKVLDYMKIKLQGDFDLKDVVVFPYAALDVMDYCNKEGNPKKELLDLSENTEKAITTMLLQTELFQRKDEQLLQLKSFYDSMTSKMQYMLAEYEQQLKKLHNLKNQNLTLFLYDLAQEYEKRCNQDVAKIITEAADTMYSKGLHVVREATYQNEESLTLIDEYLAEILKETGLRIEHLFKNSMIQMQKDIEKRFFDLNIYMEEKKHEISTDAQEFVSEIPSIGSLNRRIGFLRDLEEKAKIHSNLLEIIDEAIGRMKAYACYYTDSKTGTFAWKSGKYDLMYSGRYELAIEDWFLREKQEELNYWKNKVESLQEDIIRVDNRKFSVDSVRTQLKRKMEKNSR